MAAIALAAVGLATPVSPVLAQRVLTVIARDTALDTSPTVPAGLTTVRILLQGTMRRDLVVHRIPAGTTAEALVRGAAGRPARWFEQWSFGGPAVPRDSASDAGVTMDLRPGRYVLVSYEMDAARRPRPDRFVWREVYAVAASVLIPGRFSVPDATFKVRDSRIDVLGSMRTGQRTLQVENLGGMPHEVLIGRLKPGKTADDVRRWTADQGAAAPFVYVGGLTPMSPGITAQTRLVLQSGVHVVLCTLHGAHAKGHDSQRGVLATFKVN